jgi:lipopolysaccharide transport system ATP-binding protein
VVIGEVRSLVVGAVTVQDIQLPFVGLFVKARLGQNLFGDNTYLMCADPCRGKC